MITITRRQWLASTATSAAIATCTPAHAIFDWLNEQEAKKRLSAYPSVQDKALVDALYVRGADGKSDSSIPAVAKAGFVVAGLTTNALSLKKHAGVANLVTAEAILRSYVYDPEGDPIAQAFVSNAQQRGNFVKVYKSKMCGRLNAMFNQPMIPGRGTREYLALDNPLIEWTPSGRIKSVLVHAHQTSVTIGVAIIKYSTALFGNENARYVENNIRNSEFADYELRTLSKVEDQTPSKVDAGS